MANGDLLVFRGSWRKQLILAAACVVISGVCFFQGKKFPPMYVIGGFGLVMGAVGVWGTIRGWTVLTLDSLGFEIRHHDEPTRYTWSETSDFIADGYAIFFMRNGTERQMITNLFDASTVVICQALVSYHDKYAESSRIDAAGH